MKKAGADEPGQRGKKLTAVKKILDQVEKKLEGEVPKATLGDYIKLVQLEKELEDEDDGAKEIKVQWVKPTKTKAEPEKSTSRTRRSDRS